MLGLCPRTVGSRGRKWRRLGGQEYLASVGSQGSLPGGGGDCEEGVGESVSQGAFQLGQRHREGIDVPGQA